MATPSLNEDGGSLPGMENDSVLGFVAQATGIPLKTSVRPRNRYAELDIGRGYGTDHRRTGLSSFLQIAAGARRSAWRRRDPSPFAVAPEGILGTWTYSAQRRSWAPNLRSGKTKAAHPEDPSMMQHEPRPIAGAVLFRGPFSIPLRFEADGSRGTLLSILQDSRF